MKALLLTELLTGCVFVEDLAECIFTVFLMFVSLCVCVCVCVRKKKGTDSSHELFKGRHSCMLAMSIHIRTFLQNITASKVASMQSAESEC